MDVFTDFKISHCWSFCWSIPPISSKKHSRVVFDVLYEDSLLKARFVVLLYTKRVRRPAVVLVNCIVLNRFLRRHGFCLKYIIIVQMIPCWFRVVHWCPRWMCCCRVVQWCKRWMNCFRFVHWCKRWMRCCRVVYWCPRWKPGFQVENWCNICICYCRV